MTTLLDQILKEVHTHKLEVAAAYQMRNASTARAFSKDIRKKLNVYGKHCRELADHLIDTGVEVFVVINPAGELLVSVNEDKARKWLEAFEGDASCTPRFESVILKLESHAAIPD